jgi:hypothetical protein
MISFPNLVCSSLEAPAAIAKLVPKRNRHVRNLSVVTELTPPTLFNSMVSLLSLTRPLGPDHV